MLKLMSRIMHMRFPWNIWVGILGLVNMAGGIYFIHTVEGKLALGCLLGAFLIMQVIFNKFGFVRLLGLGHILAWVPFVAFIGWRLWSKAPLESNFRNWLVVVLIVNGISLVFDFADVYRFVKGENSEM